MLLAVDLPLCQQVEQYRTLYEECQMTAVAAQAEVSGLCVCEGEGVSGGGRGGGRGGVVVWEGEWFNSGRRH